MASWTQCIKAVLRQSGLCWRHNLIGLLQIGVNLDSDRAVACSLTGFADHARGHDTLAATRSTDNYLGGTYLHWCHAPSGRTELDGLVPLHRGSDGLDFGPA